MRKSRIALAAALAGAMAPAVAIAQDRGPGEQARPDRGPGGWPGREAGARPDFQGRGDPRGGFGQDGRDRPEQPRPAPQQPGPPAVDQRRFGGDRRPDFDPRGDRPGFSGRPDQGWRGDDPRRFGQGPGFPRHDDHRFDDRAQFRPGPDRGWRPGFDWRADRAYDWRGYRDRNRDAFRIGRYAAPRGWGYGYRRFSIGYRLPGMFFSQGYWLADPWQYRLPPAYGPYRWIRYYDDVLLVDLRSGRIVDAIPDFFW